MSDESETFKKVHQPTSEWCKSILARRPEGNNRYSPYGNDSRLSCTRSTGSSDRSWSELSDSKLHEPVKFSIGITGVKIIDKSTSKVYVDHPGRSSPLEKAPESYKRLGKMNRKRMMTLQKSVASQTYSENVQETDTQTDTLPLNEFPVYIPGKTRFEVK